MNLVGHKKNLNLLTSKASNLELPQVSLFYGPESVGKKQVGFQVAHELLQVPFSADSRLFSKTHPDFFYIEAMPPASKAKTTSSSKTGWSIKIDQIKELKKRLVHYPMEARAQVVLIDDVHLMTRTTANSLLKLLEEPTPHLYFILICSELSRVLPTIRSRCAKYSFQGLTTDELQKVLAAQDCQAVSAEFMELLSKAFQGSVWPIVSVIQSGLDLEGVQSIFHKQLSFTEIQTFIKTLPSDLDLALFLQVLKQYKLAQSLQGIDVGPMDWDGFKKAEWQLGRHISKDFILENLLMG